MLEFCEQLPVYAKSASRDALGISLTEAVSLAPAGIGASTSDRNYDLKFS
ncbi:hypothetical protein ACQPTN_40420 [Bradyrhizobium sp. 13971]